MTDVEPARGLMSDPKGPLSESVDDVLAAIERRATDVELMASIEKLADCMSVWCTTAPRQVSMKGVDGAPDWLACEMHAWQVAERVREAPRRNRLRRPGIAPAFERLAEHAAIGKGRQAWLLIGLDVGKADSARRLSKWLADEEVNGVVIKGLRPFKAAG